jgi:hypothetical protein
MVVDDALVLSGVVLGAMVVVGGEPVGGVDVDVGVVGAADGAEATLPPAAEGAASPLLPLSSLVHPLIRMISATIAGAR